jgi:competence protein ComEA
LNQADAAALTALRGIGPALAQRVVEHRQQAGPFASLDDLTQVSGIGPALVERLRPLLTVG